MLDILLGIIWVHLLTDQLLNQTLCFSYFTELIWGKFDIVPVVK